MQAWCKYPDSSSGEAGLSSSCSGAGPLSEQVPFSFIGFYILGNEIYDLREVHEN